MNISELLLTGGRARCFRKDLERRDLVALLDRAPEGRKGGSLMRIFGRWWALYQAVAFVALIPIMSYYVITHSLPKKNTSDLHSRLCSAGRRVLHEF